MENIKVKMNKPVYLGLLILEISKTIMYEFWFDYIKPKYKQNAKLCYMDTNSFIINRTEDSHDDIINNVEKRFYTLNYEIKRLPPIGRNKKVIGLMKDELGGKIMAEFAAGWIEDVNSDKKTKGTKKCITKRALKFREYLTGE